MKKTLSLLLALLMLLALLTGCGSKPGDPGSTAAPDTAAAAEPPQTEGGELALPVTGTMGMEGAQVTAGGIVTREFDPATLQSRIVPGLYATGEVLDVDGDRGGFNLQWAWSSGLLAGQMKE